MASSSSAPPPEEDDMPLHLMPVAALLGLYAAGSFCRVLYLVYTSVAPPKPSQTKPLRSTKQVVQSASVPLQSQSFFILVLTMIISVIGYAYVVAMVEGTAAAAEHARFDPYRILQIRTDTTNATAIKQAYRKLSLRHHPDKLSPSATAAEREAATKLFYNLQAAYSALTTDAGRQNFQKHGHPDGPLERPAFKLALPAWLLFPKGKIAAVMILLYMAMLGFLIYWVITGMQAAAKRAADEEAAAAANMSGSMLDKTNTVTVEDLRYLSSQLEPNSSHLEVLMAVLSTPENILWCTEQAVRVEDQRAERREQIRKEKENKPSKGSDSMDIDEIVNIGGWEDDDDDDDDNGNATDNAASSAGAAKDKDEPALSEEQEALAKAKKAEKEKEADLERLKRATGKAVTLMEGIDEGVLGQQWVERTMAKCKAWPPPVMGCLEGRTFAYPSKKNGNNNTTSSKADKTTAAEEQLSAMDHPGVRLMLCMTMGRLNAHMLNSHPDLLEAGAHKLIDQTYFKACMEFRQRIGVLLEAALRVAMACRSFRLTATVVDVVAMFKIGIPASAVAISQFHKIMMAQYGCLPKVKIHDPKLETPDEADICTGDQAILSFGMERTHAEKFLQQKLHQFQKQGIPPQVALQAYREGWWCIFRYERLDKGEPLVLEPLLEQSPVLKQMEIADEDIAKFQKEDAPYRLVTAWPVICQKIAQKTGDAKIQITVPDAPGRYRLICHIKSQDFLGVDEQFHVDFTCHAKTGRRDGTNKTATSTKTEPSSSTTTTTKEAEERQGNGDGGEHKDDQQEEEDKKDK